MNTIKNVQSYLFSNGRCEEAPEFGVLWMILTAAEGKAAKQ